MSLLPKQPLSCGRWVKTVCPYSVTAPSIIANLYQVPSIRWKIAGVPIKFSMICSLVCAASTVDIGDIMLNVGILILATAFSAQARNSSIEELEQIKSLNEVENLQIFGDLITIVLKNVSESDAEGCDAFDQYLENHLIRIKSPLKEGEHFDFKLNDLISDNEVEGREKRRKGPIREILIPLLMALKYKSTVVLPIFMMLVTFIAFKGFWAGMSGLVISKVVGLKVLLQYLNKPDEDHDESENQDDYHDQSQDNGEENEENEKPIVVFLHPHSQRRKLLRRHDKAPMAKKHYKPKGWNSWARQRGYENNLLGP